MTYTNENAARSLYAQKLENLRKTYPGYCGGRSARSLNDEIRQCRRLTVSQDYKTEFRTKHGFTPSDNALLWHDAIDLFTRELGLPQYNDDEEWLEPSDEAEDYIRYNYDWMY